MPRRWSGLTRVALAVLAGGLLACAGRAVAEAVGIEPTTVLGPQRFSRACPRPCRSTSVELRRRVRGLAKSQAVSETSRS